MSFNRSIVHLEHLSRQNRVYMIQTVEQYVFLYRTLIEGILTVDTSIPLQEFLSTKKLRMDSKSQYKVKTRVSPRHASVLSLLLRISSWSSCNRISNILTVEHSIQPM